LVIIDVAVASPFRPPILTYLFASGTGEFVELPCAPCFKLTANVIGVTVRRNDDVDVIGTAIDRIEMPATDPTMVGNCFLDKRSLIFSQITRRVLQEFLCPLPQICVGRLGAMSSLHPTSFVAG